MPYNVFYTYNGCDCIKSFTNKQKAIAFHTRCKLNDYSFVSKDF